LERGSARPASRCTPATTSLTMAGRPGRPDRSVEKFQHTALLKIWKGPKHEIFVAKFYLRNSSLYGWWLKKKIPVPKKGKIILIWAWYAVLFANLMLA
jgi:hypothetical protein